MVCGAQVEYLPIKADLSFSSHSPRPNRYAVPKGRALWGSCLRPTTTFCNLRSRFQTCPLSQLGVYARRPVGSRTPERSWFAGPFATETCPLWLDREARLDWPGPKGRNRGFGDSNVCPKNLTFQRGVALYRTVFTLVLEVMVCGE